MDEGDFADDISEQDVERLTLQMSTKAEFKERYDLIEKINSGSFAVVNKCRKRANGKFYAVKFIKKGKVSKSNKMVILNEIVINKKLNHRHIVHLYETFEDKSFSMMVFELINGGELFDEIVQRSTFSEKDAHDFTIQIFEGLAYCHSQGIIHRDIKPENILLNKGPEATTIKIADFGVAKDISKSGERHFPLAGSLGYMAPEVALKKKNSIKCDAFSCGVILYILICGYPPFPQSNNKSVMLNATRNPNIHFDTKNWSGVTSECIELTKLLTKTDPSERYSISDALKHKWSTRIEDLEKAKVFRQDSLQDFIQFNIKRKFMTMLGVFSIAGMINDTIQESRRTASMDNPSTTESIDLPRAISEENIARDHVIEAELTRRDNFQMFREFLHEAGWTLAVNGEIKATPEEFRDATAKLQNGLKAPLTGKDLEVKVQKLKANIFWAHVHVPTAEPKETIVYTLQENIITSCAVFSHT